MGALFERDRPLITDTNLSPVISVVVYLLLGFNILSVSVRFLTRWTIAQSMGLDDLLIFIALLFASGESVAALAAADTGTGRSIKELTASSVNETLKTQYIAELLFIAGLWATKCSILSFLSSITPVKAHHFVIWTTGGAISIWALTGIFAVAFGCPPPQSWNYANPHCIDKVAFELYLSILNTLTEVALIVIPIVIILPLKTSKARRVTLTVCFAARLLVVTASIVQAAYIQYAFDTSQDYTLNVWIWMVSTEIVQGLSIMTACVPYMKPFLESLQAGALRTDSAHTRLVGASGDGSKTRATRRDYHEISKAGGTS